MPDRPGKHLFRIEVELERISVRLHALVRRRTELEQRRARLRMSLTYDELVHYEALRLGESLETEVRPG